MQIRVYYEDTDCGGVVYYANYLRYFERARTEYLRDRGIEVAAFADAGILFVVSHVEISYRSPARYNDLLKMETRISGHTRTRLTFAHTLREQEVSRVVVEGEVTLACIDAQGKPRRLPEEILHLAEKERPPTAGGSIKSGR